MEHGGFVYQTAGDDHWFYYGVQAAGSLGPEKSVMPSEKLSSAAKKAHSLQKGLASSREGLLSVASGVAKAKANSFHMVQSQVAKMNSKTVESVEELMKKYDCDSDGNVSRDELMAIIVDLREGKKEANTL